jgi:hypothetical protein
MKRYIIRKTLAPLALAITGLALVHASSHH